MVWIVSHTKSVHWWLSFPSLSKTLASFYPQGILKGLGWMDAMHFLHLKEQGQLDPKVI